MMNDYHTVVYYHQTNGLLTNRLLVCNHMPIADRIGRLSPVATEYAVLYGSGIGYRPIGAPVATELAPTFSGM